MTKDSAQDGSRILPACPWCGSGTPLQVIGDGMGSQSLTCTACGCKGPPTPIASDFAVADETAIRRWSRRKATQKPPIEAGVAQRIRHAIAFQALLGERLSPDTHVSLRLADLEHVLRAAGTPMIEQSGRAAA